MPLPADPDNSLGFLVSDVARMLRQAFNRCVAPIGLTQAQARVLLHLARCEGVSQKALADILEIQPITLLRQLDKLAEQGLIERRPNPSDRRAQCLFLTRASEPLLAEVWAVGERLREQLVAGLDEADARHLVSMLQQLRSNLSDAPPDASRPTGTRDQEG